MALHTRQDHYGAITNVVTEQLYRTSRLVCALTGVSVQPNKAIVGDNAFAHESGIHQDGVLKERTTYEIMTPESIGLRQSRLVLGKHSGRHAFREKLRELGYSLSEEDINRAFERFIELADKKKTITDRDIEAIIETGGSPYLEPSSWSMSMLSVATRRCPRPPRGSGMGTGGGGGGLRRRSHRCSLSGQQPSDECSRPSAGLRPCRPSPGADALGDATVRVRTMAHSHRPGNQHRCHRGQRPLISTRSTKSFTVGKSISRLGR